MTTSFDDKKHNEREEFLLAQIALALHEQDVIGQSACPPDEELALLAEGKLSEDRRNEVLVHMDTCSECYQNWLNIETALK